MKFRYIRIDDVPVCAKIAGMNFWEHLEKSAFKEIQETFNKKDPLPPQYIVVEEKGKIIWFAGFINAWMDYNIYEIFWVNIHPDYQGQWIGTKLVEKVISHIKKHQNVLKILLTTKKPWFYQEKFWFREISQLKEDEVLMELNISR